MKKNPTIKNLISEDALKEMELNAEKHELLQKFKEILDNFDEDQLKNTSFQLKDLFEIYLDCDLAGDNDDRRSKLCCVKIIEEFLELANNYKLA